MDKEKEDIKHLYSQEEIDTILNRFKDNETLLNALKNYQKKQQLYQKLYGKKYNYTPNKLAELSAIAPSTLRALLANNVDNPSSTIIFKICKTLKIELKDFYDSPLFDMEKLEY